MLIAHITDPHFGLDTRSLPGHPGPEKAFRRALQHVLAMDPAPEVLLLTGDLTDGGAKSDYLALRDVLHEMLPPPSAGGPRVWAILGNHDERGAARAVLGEWLGSAPELTTNPDSPACTYAQHGGLHFIGLDTLVPRKAHGELDDAQLDWLARTLDRCAGQPVLIFMHHPPLESGMAIMDAAGLLRGRDQLAQLVRAHAELGDVLREQRQSLVQRELLLDTMVQNTPVAMLLLADGGDGVQRVAFSNLAARKLLHGGWKLEGKRMPELLEAMPVELRNAIARGGDSLFAVRENDGDEDDEQVYHLSRRHFHLNGRPHELLLLRLLTAELRRQEVQTWKKVIRVISHELNNSLAPIASLAHSGAELVRRGRH